MKNWLLKMIMGLMTLLPLAVFAGECEDPLGKTYQYDGVSIHFAQGYQQDTIAQIAVDGNPSIFYNYIWDLKTCTATLLSEPPLYLQFDETWFDVSENPYRFAIVTSTD